MALTYSQNWDGETIVGWTLGTGLVRTSTGHSTPYALELSNGSTGKVFATFNTQDASAGNLELNCKVRFTADGLSVGAWHAGPAARASATPMNDSSTSFYWADLEYRPKLGQYRLLINKTVNGVTLTLAFTQILDIVPHAWYDVKLRISGSGPVRLQAALRRVSDGFWLSPTDFEFHSGALLVAVDVVDSSSPLSGSGYSGVVYQSSSGSHIITDDFDIAPFLTVQDSLAITPSTAPIREKIAAATASVGLATTTTSRRDLLESVSVVVGITPVVANVANLFTVAVAVPFNLAAAISELTDKFASVSVPLALSTPPSGVREKPASVTTAISIAHAQSEISEHVSAVAVPINLSGSTTGAVNVGEFPATVIASLGWVAAPAGAKQTDVASVVDTFRIFDAPARSSSPISAAIAESIRFSDETIASGIRVYSASATDVILLSTSTAEFLQRIIDVSMFDTIRLSGVISHGIRGEWNTSVENTLVLSTPPASSGTFRISVGITDAILFRSVASSVGHRLYSVVATDTLRIYDGQSVLREANASVSDVLSLSDGILEAGQTARSVSQEIVFATLVRAGREINAGVLESLALTTPPEPPVGFPPADVPTSINLSANPDSIPGVRGDVSPDSIRFSASISSAVESLGSDFFLPVLSGIDVEWPVTWAESPEGDIVLANGVDRMAVCRPLPGAGEFIGIAPPATQPLLGGTDAGVITGRRASFVRFIDEDGNPSALSPVSNVVDFGWERPIDDIRVGSSGAVAVTVPDHGLKTGSEAVIRDVGGIPQANAKLLVVRLDEDNLGLNGVLSSSGQQWHGGGSLVYGIKTVVYSNVPTSSEPKVVRRQILRNLEGNASVFYVDIDTTDLSSTTFTSERLDDSLRLQEPVVIEGEGGKSYESRHALPPSNKPIVASYAGRLWAAGEVAYDTGCVMPEQGSASVRGVATNWKRSMVGRLLYINGARQAYGIVAVDETNQRITLDGPVLDTNLPRFATYVIRSAPMDRRVLRYSDPGAYDVWPADNAISIPEDGGGVVGLVRHGQSLCVVCEQRIYRIVARSDPSQDASLFLMAYRGAVNHRCIVEADGHLFMLDDQGVHRYDGSESAVPVSDDIQALLRTDGVSDFPQIDWASKDRRLWHGSVDPTRATLRWFVDFNGKEHLTHALCYNYRSKSWWLEQYPFRVASSGTGDLGHRGSIAGCELRRVVALGSGQTDLAVPGDGTLQGTATSATSLGLSDATASFPDSLAGSPFAITGGPGKGQGGVIVGNTPTSIEWRDALDPAPAAGSTYQIGGIAWEWRSGWYDQAEEERDTDTSLSVAYEPQSTQCCFDARLHRDHAGAPDAWGYTSSEDGVTSEADSPDLVFDLAANQAGQGYRLARLSAHSAKHVYGGQCVQLRLSGVQGAEQTRIYRIDISGAEFTKEE